MLSKLDPLTEDLVLSKPLQQGSFLEEVIYRLEREKRLIITRKRNGWKLFAVRTKGKWKIYTDGMNEVLCLDHVKSDLEKLGFGNKTMLVGEGIVDLDGNDSFQKVQGILQSGKEKAVKKQTEIGFMKFMVFAVILLDGERLADPYGKHLEFINKVLGGNKFNYLLAVPVIDMTFDEAKKMVIEKKKSNKHGWEGLVLYSKDFVYSYRLDGKNPERPGGCYKWKPLYEDDFIVRTVLTDSKKKLVREVFLTQIDPETGREFPCGKFGSFSKPTRAWLHTAKLPLVIQLIFEARYGTGKLCNKRMGEAGFRTDKKPEDCIAPKSFSGK